MKRIIYAVLTLAAFTGGRMLMKSNTFTSASSTNKRDYNLDLDKWFASGAKYNKGKFKVGTEEIPYDEVLYPDHTGTITLHLKDGTDSVVKMTFELKGKTITYYYTNAAGDTWEYAATIDELMKANNTVRY